jgi:predicted NUDIX family NTP pyrophosphohydrolase
MQPRISAGILAYRFRSGGLEVLLVHPGGPFFAKKNLGSWTIPKGEVDEGDLDFEQTARREFEEEVGLPVPARELLPLGSIRQKTGKIVHAWAVEGDLDTSAMHSNMIHIPWPPFSKGRDWPEVDRWAYFGREEARRHIKDTQAPLLDRLEAALAEAGPETWSTEAGSAPMAGAE